MTESRLNYEGVMSHASVAAPASPTLYVRMYSTWECILHENVFYIRMYSTWECILHENLFYMRMYSTWECILHENVFYMRMYPAAGCNVHVNGLYMTRDSRHTPLRCVWEYILHENTFCIRMYSKRECILHPQRVLRRSIHLTRQTLQLFLAYECILYTKNTFSYRIHSHHITCCSCFPFSGGCVSLHLCACVGLCAWCYVEYILI